VTGQPRSERRTQNRVVRLFTDPAHPDCLDYRYLGDQAREAQVLNALFRILRRNREATIALFDLIKHQPGY
jgi:type I restriction enzyme R subunit